jgi:GNAT superfamily N-acetyltransferase
MVLRKARSEDVAALLELHRTALRALSSGHYTERLVESVLRYLPTLDEALIADQTYFVVEGNGQLVACGGWSRRTPGYGSVLDLRRGLADDQADAGDCPALIRAMYTHPDWTRRGLGRWILSAAEAEARECSAEIELDALLPGVALYSACGYQALERREAALPDGELLPIVYMRKCIRTAVPAVPAGSAPSNCRAQRPAYSQRLAERL